jgi:hypothetical protein
MRRILQTTGFGIAVAGAFFGYAFAAPLEDGDISIDAATRRRCKNGNDFGHGVQQDYTLAVQW